MSIIFKLSLGMSLSLGCGCGVFHDAEVARQDVEKAMVVWHKDIEPRLETLKDVAEKASAEIENDRQKIEAVWADFKSHLEKLEQAIGSVESAVDKDLLRVDSLWQKDVAPQISRLEAFLDGIGSKLKQDLDQELVSWHKVMERHLSQLEQVVGTAEADIDEFAKRYLDLKVDLRSIKVRTEKDIEDDPVAKHVDSLLHHVEDLAKKHATGITHAAISEVRSKIEADVSEVLRKL